MELVKKLKYFRENCNHEYIFKDSDFSKDELQVLSLFAGLFNNINLFYKDDINYYFFNKDCLFAHKLSDNTLHFNIIYWGIFTREYNFENSDLNYFLKISISNHFKIKVENIIIDEISFFEIEKIYSNEYISIKVKNYSNSLFNKIKLLYKKVFY